jgi:DNA-binding transcriptional ArsR family regulator
MNDLTAIAGGLTHLIDQEEARIAELAPQLTAAENTIRRARKALAALEDASPSVIAKTGNRKVTPSQLTDATLDRVLKALRAGASTPGEIRKHSKLSYPTISRALEMLRQRQQVRRIDARHYALMPDA